MEQSEGLTLKDQIGKVCKPKRSIYGLKKASKSWNIYFDNEVKSFGFIQNINEPNVYKKVSESTIAFLVLYIDDILLIGNDIGLLSNIKTWFSSILSMKNLGEVAYILGIQI